MVASTSLLISARWWTPRAEEAVRSARGRRCRRASSRRRSAARSRASPCSPAEGPCPVTVRSVLKASAVAAAHLPGGSSAFLDDPDALGEEGVGVLGALDEEVLQLGVGDDE